VTDGGDTALMSEFATTGKLDAILDFGFSWGARDFVSQGHDKTALAGIFERDAWYTDHDGTAQNAVTFLSNHDAGRFRLLPQGGQSARRSPAAGRPRPPGL